MLRVPSHDCDLSRRSSVCLRVMTCATVPYAKDMGCPPYLHNAS